ncbi:MAG: ABC transporter ATPase [Sphingobacteriales bacterium]|nr:ABC transporter ATPase [Sphingobacteriales bacterium]
MLTPYHILPDDAKVWIYQANRSFTPEEVWDISDILENFVDKWQSHQRDVAGYGSLYYRRFLVLMADENKCDVSGCSIDSSVKLIRELEQAYDINFFDRMKVCYKITNELVGSFPLLQLNELMEKGKLTEQTIIFNNLVSTKKDFETKWEIPLNESPFIKFTV